MRSSSLAGLDLHWRCFYLADCIVHHNFLESMPGDNTHKNFKGQLSDEHVVCFTRKHWLRTIPLFSSLLALLASPIVFAIMFSKDSLIGLLGKGGFFALAGFYTAVSTYFLHLIFVRIFNYYLRILIITNQRVVDLKKTLFLCDHRSTVILSEIQDISMNKDGLLQTIFNFGTITVVISGVSQALTLNHIPNPDYHFRKMIQSRQEYIANLASLRQQVPIQVPNRVSEVVLQAEPVDARPLVFPTYTA